MKMYDGQHKRLVFLGEKSNDHFWDRLWSNDANLKQTIERGSRERWVKNITKRFLPSGGKVLEGGCGRGDKVFGLDSWGYEGYGVDYAEETVKKIKNLFPRLRIQAGDVRHLKFSDAFFDGYWSIGVIEHFFEGCEPIVSEMARVLKSGGYGFVTFPYMSPVRRCKARLDLYPRFTAVSAPDDFYQFALAHKPIIELFKKYKLSPVYIRPLDAIKGLKDEVSLLTPALKWLYHSRAFFARVLRLGINTLAEPFAGHVILIVFQKQS